MKNPLKNTLLQLEFLKKIKLFNIYRFNNIYILYNRVHFSRHFVFDFVDAYHMVRGYNVFDSQLDRLSRLWLSEWTHFGTFCGALRFSVQLH